MGWLRAAVVEPMAPIHSFLVPHLLEDLDRTQENTIKIFEQMWHQKAVDWSDWLDHSSSTNSHLNLRLPGFSNHLPDPGLTSEPLDDSSDDVDFVGSLVVAQAAELSLVTHVLPAPAVDFVGSLVVAAAAAAELPLVPHVLPGYRRPCTAFNRVLAGVKVQRLVFA